MEFMLVAGNMNTTGTMVGNMNTNKGFVFESYPQRIFIGCLLLAVFIIGTIGNSLTILAVILTKKLQTVTNTFVINLAVSDLLACLFIPWSVVGMFNRHEWPKELSLACTIAGGILSVSVGCSFYTLASIALNRLILIKCNKHRYHEIFNLPTLVIWVGVIWTIPFGIVILPPIFGIGALGFNPKYKTCSDISEGYHDNASQTYDYIQAAGVFPLPMLVLVVSYSMILHIVWSHSKNFVIREVPAAQYPRAVAETTMTSSSADSQEPEKQPPLVCVAMSTESLNNMADTPGETPSTLKRVTRMSRREVQVTKNLFIILCAFLICLFPYVVCLVIDDTDPAIPYAVGILLTSSCVNPIIYAIRFPNFKMVFKCILKRQWHAIPEPAWLLRRLRFHHGCCAAHY